MKIKLLEEINYTLSDFESWNEHHFTITKDTILDAVVVDDKWLDQEDGFRDCFGRYEGMVVIGENLWDSDKYCTDEVDWTFLEENQYEIVTT